MLELDYKNREPSQVEDAPISFEMVENPPLEEMNNAGDIQTISLTIENLSGSPQGMLVSIVSIPSCMDIDMDQLELLKDNGEINNFKIDHDYQQVILYWTYLKEAEEKSISLNLVQMFGGAEQFNCVRRASQAYLYYADDQKVWLY